ncbi:MAG: hypothetical protein ACLRRS_01265 [Faecalibacterium prausnitzii]
MEKTMTAKELYDYIQRFTSVLVSAGQGNNVLFTWIRTERVELHKINGIPDIFGNVMKRPKKRNGGFSLSGASFQCNIVEEDENNHVVTVTSDTMPFPVTLSLQM